jgi:anti-sigma B factor antagonist
VLSDQAQEVEVSATTQEPVIDVVQATGTITAIDLKGEFDFANASELLEHVRRALDSGQHVIVNLSDATFIDSAIVHALFTAGELASAGNRQCVLQVGTHPGVERVLSLTGTDKALTRASGRREAVDRIDQAVV